MIIPNKKRSKAHGINIINQNEIKCEIALTDLKMTYGSPEVIDS